MLKSWTKFERVWLVVFSVLIVGTTVGFNLLYGTDWSDTNLVILNWVISPVSALTGIVCVLLVAKYNIQNYAWGLINALSYGYVAFAAGYYGDMMLNWFYFVPFQLIGFLVWRKRLRSDSKYEIKVRKMTLTQKLVFFVLGVAIAVGFGYVLSGVDGWFITAMKRNESIYTYLNTVTGVPMFGPIFDASTEVFQILAQVLMTWAFAEQWGLWLANNIITILMWVMVVIAEPSFAPMAAISCLLYVAYLVNSGYGMHNWNKEAKRLKAAGI
jgi:nicotinamide mononucleotide transporter